MSVLSSPDAVRAAARQTRLAARAGTLASPTAGMAPGAVQGNLAILPHAWADDFMRFCQFNPKPCPLLAVSEPGDHRLPDLGEDLDIRSDLPMYRIFREGRLERETPDIGSLWQDDFLAFVLGCSFSFEEALIGAGLPLRHWALGMDVPMYRTSIATAPAGPFAGPMVVSMRPFRPADAIRAIQITSRFPRVHGAPVHFGDPGQIGIDDLDRPDWGAAVPVEPGETPVFWACGVTPQAVIEQARPPICITHAPGHMLVTDRLNAEYAVF